MTHTSQAMQMAFGILFFMANAHITKMRATPKSAAARLPARLYALLLKSVDQLNSSFKPWVASSILLSPFFQIAVDGCIGRSAFVEQLLQPYYGCLA